MKVCLFFFVLFFVQSRTRSRDECSESSCNRDWRVLKACLLVDRLILWKSISVTKSATLHIWYYQIRNFTHPGSNLRFGIPKCANMRIWLPIYTLFFIRTSLIRT